MRYFAEIAFLGAAYHGWQRQPGDLTVQEVVEKAFSTILRTTTPVTGAGRTDAGVNARKMVAHFDCELEIPEPRRLVAQLNAILPADIAVNHIYPVSAGAHARFDAVCRTYHYYAIPFKSPFFGTLAWKAPASLDYEAMNQAACLLLQTEDFTSFSKLHTDTKTNICHVTRAAWEPCGEGWVFIIKADRFLRNMVRAIVGTLVEVGRGKMSIDEFQSVIESQNRCQAGTSMPAHALYLWDVEY